MRPDARLRRDRLRRHLPVARRPRAATSTRTPPPCRPWPGSASASSTSGRSRSSRCAAAVEVERLAEQQAVGFPEPFPNLGAADLARRLERAGPFGVPRLVRLAVRPVRRRTQATAECRRMIARLAPHVDLFALDDAADGWRTAGRRRGDHVRVVRAAAARKPLLLVRAGRP